jgi:hypothetical protein
MTNFAFISFRPRGTDYRKDHAINFEYWLGREELFEKKVTSRAVVVISTTDNSLLAFYRAQGLPCVSIL